MTASDKFITIAICLTILALGGELVACNIHIARECYNTVRTAIVAGHALPEHSACVVPF